MTSALGPLAVPLDVPVGWSDPPSVNLFHAIVLLGGIPLVLFVVITIAVYLPSVIRGERVAPGQPAMQDQWLGGPASAPAELSAGSGSERPVGQPVPQSAGESAGSETGGASGRW